jgi:VIT1/CCC1 family predicted Fe2+/Mn2+ transporter
VQQDLIRQEQELLALSPEEEMEELARHFQAKGVSEETARTVAEELSAADALSAQLETEYGIDQIMGATHPLKEALGSGLFFLLGSLVPVLIAILVPRGLVDEFEVVGVILSLTLTSLILSRLAHTHVLPTIVRSLVIGIAAMGTAALIGSLVT